MGASEDEDAAFVFEPLHVAQQRLPGELLHQILPPLPQIEAAVQIKVEFIVEQQWYQRDNELQSRSDRTSSSSLELILDESLGFPLIVI